MASLENESVPTQSKKGLYQLESNDAMLAAQKAMSQKLTSLTSIFEKFQAYAIQTQPPPPICDFCGGEHENTNCGALGGTEAASMNGIWNDQRNSGNLQKNQSSPYGDTYNPRWKNHPGFNYNSTQHQLNPPIPPQSQPSQSNPSELEKALKQLSRTTNNYIQGSETFRNETTFFMQETRTAMRNQEASIKNFETQIGQLSKQIFERAQGTFPGETIPNPRREHCNAITTMSEKVIQPIEKNSDEKKRNEEKEKGDEADANADIGGKEKKVTKESAAEKVVPKKKEFKWEKKKAQERQEKPFELSPYAKIPYPQRFRQEIQKQQYSRFLDIFNKLQINIPFAEALESMPNYVKFMKDLLSRKRKLQECETVTLIEECSAIIQKKLSQKLKDPGSFSIPCNIGNVKVDNVLCDLGASINVMPLSMMKKLGITEVKPTKTIVQLADRSTKQAYGIIEDILVKVDKFIIPVDFVILDIEENSTVPMIFGRPFLATLGALIDVSKGELILRVDEEQSIFKFFDKEIPSPITQPEDQVYYISEKKGEEKHKENSPQEESSLLLGRYRVIPASLLRQLFE
ncbi:uncharacterized protein LOC133286060 [Gastrolobium bilobum]|uniref:uncharacterized protein LOC133286060 n=1 Tax=Gastrolobium bilobum TaxID=150636 RepID=UPI002AAF40DD|nr:uncharacterized protein LOC133286060 [Gastrolobium bilobum]